MLITILNNVYWQERKATTIWVLWRIHGGGDGGDRPHLDGIHLRKFFIFFASRNSHFGAFSGPSE